MYNGVEQWSDQLEKIDESGNPFEEGRYIHTRSATLAAP